MTLAFSLFSSQANKQFQNSLIFVSMAKQNDLGLSIYRESRFVRAHSVRSPWTSPVASWFLVRTWWQRAREYMPKVIPCGERKQETHRRGDVTHFKIICSLYKTKLILHQCGPPQPNYLFNVWSPPTTNKLVI